MYRDNSTVNCHSQLEFKTKNKVLTTPCFLKQDFEKSASLMLTHDRGTSIDVIVAIIGPPERPECQNALKREMTQVGEVFTFNSIL